MGKLSVSMRQWIRLVRQYNRNGEKVKDFNKLVNHLEKSSSLDLKIKGLSVFNNVPLCLALLDSESLAIKSEKASKELGKLSAVKHGKHVERSKVIRALIEKE